MALTDDAPHLTLEQLDTRVRALESGSNSWAAMVGEDVRSMLHDFAALQEEVARLRARLDG